MATIEDLLDINDWKFRADIPDNMWEKMEKMAEETSSYLSVGAGGSVIYQQGTTTYQPENGIVPYNASDATSPRSWEVKRDPLLFSKAKYHGFIKNLDTKEIRRFQFNPEKFEYTRGVTYSDSISPGMAYPETQFSHGNIREFDIELFMYDPYCVGLIKEYMVFIGAFLTPETNVPGYSRPPEMLFYYGYFIRRCVLTNFKIAHEWLDEQGTPLMSRFTLTLRQVGVDEL